MVTIAQKIEFEYQKGHSFPYDYLSFVGRFHLKMKGRYISYEGFNIPIEISFIAKNCEFRHFSVKMIDIWGFGLLDGQTERHLKNLEYVLNRLDKETVFRMIKEDIFDDIEESINSEPKLHDMRFFFLPI